MSLLLPLRHDRGHEVAGKAAWNMFEVRVGSAIRAGLVVVSKKGFMFEY